MPLPVLLNLILLYLILSGLAGFFGRNRRIGFWGFFFLSIILTPVLSLIFIFAAAPVRHHHAAAPAKRE